MCKRGRRYTTWLALKGGMCLLQTRAIEGLKALRGGMCSSCANKLTFEMVRTHVIQYDPIYILAYQRLFQKRSRS